MYINKESGLEVYENFQELLNNEIVEAWEFEKKLYLRLKGKDNYDNSMWVVDKSTENVSLMYYTDFIIDIMDKAKSINLKTIKETD